MSKRIDVPSYLRYIVECVFKPSQSNCHLINYILIIGGGLIGHTPTSINKL